MNEPNLNEIATQPPIYINGKHLKGLILDEVMESNPLLPNYTLLLRTYQSGDKLIISSAKYIRRDDSQSGVETKEVFPPIADPNERNVFINFEKKQTFRTLRRTYSKLLPSSQKYFQILLSALFRLMELELHRTANRRKKE